ncbi:multidrug efflux SMR transporter [Paenibacillus frigoriresistens]|jgi:small multidrug resistance pump|uniref:DMT family transporter n=1 Tax=Paenibacillus alginolyticus TaxID=59839 RepID=UPI001563D05D|nr:multidrug efflux SMR transporter [Paenibacillus frigoriresistens]NRF91685.1 multidrug efflux SMR transporter [Paenibacillus frigoriresistens]
MKIETGWGWIFLLLAILFELSGTTAMKLSEGFTRFWPSLLMFVLYGCSFTLLNFALTYIEVGIAYAIWSGVGIVLITIVGFVLFKESFDLTKLAWMSLIIIGVIGLKLSSKVQ